MSKYVYPVIIFLMCFYILYQDISYRYLISAIKSHKPIKENETSYYCYDNEDFLNNYRPRRVVWKNKKIK